MEECLDWLKGLRVKFYLEDSGVEEIGEEGLIVQEKGEDMGDDNIEKVKDEDGEEVKDEGEKKKRKKDKAIDDIFGGDNNKPKKLKKEKKKKKRKNAIDDIFG
ncbi:hypothetical protein TL16_g08819 [Triparma laevis f. inornata]|uniref:Uncharacterized protein n=1 Tax=Triparma laevis f. inornata TaxID=1714386 RepID=A0A9W7AZQ0_9STRA|nr:hypothetical protein TL16_g08819 [Triparma laevis f. inornata]